MGRIMAMDGDVGINARMTYSLEDDLEESSTFIIRTDPVTQEGVLLLAKVNAYTAHILLSLIHKFCTHVFNFIFHF